MSKGIYRSVNVEGVAVASLLTVLTTATVIVGLDVAKFDLTAAFALDTGQIVQIVKFNQLQQTPLFLALIAALQQAGRTIQIALEPTGTYCDALRLKFHHHGVSVFMVPAKHVHDARELYDNVPSKHDPKDAVTLARLRSQGGGSLWQPIDPFRRDVRALVETREVHHEPLMQGYNRLEALLARHWPELSSQVNVYETSSLWKLLERMPGPQEITAHAQEARELLSKESRRALGAAAIETIIVSARDTMGVVPTPREKTQMQRVVSEMLRHREEVREVDRELRVLLGTRPEFGPMVRWVGLVTSAVLLGCVGDPKDFHHAGAYEKACGLNLKEESSGTAVRRGLHITHRGSACARKYLYMFVLRWKARDGVACAWVEKRQSWPRKGGKISAMVALMRKAICAIWHLRRGSDYQARLLFDLRRLVLAPPVQTALISEADASEPEAPCPSVRPAAASEATPTPPMATDEIKREMTPTRDDAPHARPTRSNASRTTTVAKTTKTIATGTASDDASKAEHGPDNTTTMATTTTAATTATATTATATAMTLAKGGATARQGSHGGRGGVASDRKPRRSASKSPRPVAGSARDGSHTGPSDNGIRSPSTGARASANPAVTASSPSGTTRTLSTTLERLNALVRASR